MGWAGYTRPPARASHYFTCVTALRSRRVPDVLGVPPGRSGGGGVKGEAGEASLGKTQAGAAHATVSEFRDGVAPLCLWHGKVPSLRK